MLFRPANIVNGTSIKLHLWNSLRGCHCSVWNQNKNPEHLHIVPLRDIFYLIASVLIRLSKCPVSWWRAGRLCSACEAHGGSRRSTVAGCALMNGGAGSIDACQEKLSITTMQQAHTGFGPSKFSPPQHQDDSSYFVLLSCSWSLHPVDQFIICIQDRAAKLICKDIFGAK